MKLKSVLSVLVLSMAAASVFAAPSEINIAYVKAPFNLQNMVMKHNNMLENEFKKDGIKINGTTSLPALNRHKPWQPVPWMSAPQ